MEHGAKALPIDAVSVAVTTDQPKAAIVKEFRQAAEDDVATMGFECRKRRRYERRFNRDVAVDDEHSAGPGRVQNDVACRRQIGMPSND